MNGKNTQPYSLWQKIHWEKILQRLQWWLPDYIALSCTDPKGQEHLLKLLRNFPTYTPQLSLTVNRNNLQALQPNSKILRRYPANRLLYVKDEMQTSRCWCLCGVVVVLCSTTTNAPIGREERKAVVGHSFLAESFHCVRFPVCSRRWDRFRALSLTRCAGYDITLLRNVAEICTCALVVAKVRCTLFTAEWKLVDTVAVYVFRKSMWSLG